MDEIDRLIERLDFARSKIESLLPSVNPEKEIYPNWTIHEFLAHLTGWDDAVIAALRSHIDGEPPATPAARGIDVYNAETVSTRETMDYPHIRDEWRATREALKSLLRSISGEKYRQPLDTPWGSTSSVEKFIEVFIGHEAEEHAPDLSDWLTHPDQPLLGRH